MSPCYVDPVPLFSPAMRVISAINQDTVMTEIVTTTPHGYTAGLIVRFNIPRACGMQELNKEIYEIADVPAPDTFRIMLDSSRFTPFSIPMAVFPPWAPTCAQITPVGNNTAVIGGARNTLDLDQEV